MKFRTTPSVDPFTRFETREASITRVIRVVRIAETSPHPRNRIPPQNRVPRVYGRREMSRLLICKGILFGKAGVISPICDARNTRERVLPRGRAHVCMYVRLRPHPRRRSSRRSSRQSALCAPLNCGISYRGISQKETTGMFKRASAMGLQMRESLPLSVSLARSRSLSRDHRWRRWRRTVAARKVTRAPYGNF